jgi:hypothetical protein
MIAAALMVLQVMVAGLLSAQAAAAAMAGPFEAVICHGGAGSGGTTANLPDGSAPADQHWNACCAFCLAASSAPVLAQAPEAVSPPVTTADVPLAWHEPAVPIDRRAVRAGSSQAPPSKVAT